MNYDEQKALFEELVISKITQTEFGLIELPIKGLQEFHDRVGLAPDQYCHFSLRLPGAEESIFNYVLGYFTENEMHYEIDSVFFYDDTSCDSVEIPCNDLIRGAFERNLFNGEALCSGDIMIDNLGRVWIDFMMTDDIGVRIVAELNPNSIGVPIYLEDLSMSARIWFNGESFCYSPTTMYYYDSNTYLPS